MRYFKVLKAKDDTKYHSHFVKNDIVEIKRVYSSGDLELNGPSCLDGVIIDQTGHPSDGFEVGLISIYDIKQGDVVYVDSEIESNLGYLKAKPRTNIKVYQVDLQNPTLPPAIQLDAGHGPVWFYKEELLKTNFYRAVPELVFEVAEEAPTPIAKIEKVVAEPRPVVVYEVLIEGVSLQFVKSRRSARRLKASLGGKASGVTIQQYVRSKEIR